MNTKQLIKLAKETSEKMNHGVFHSSGIPQNKFVHCVTESVIDEFRMTHYENGCGYNPLINYEENIEREDPIVEILNSETINYTPYVIMAAYLHDLVKDDRITTLDLTKNGFPKQVIRMVEILTTSVTKSYFVYIAGIINSRNLGAIAIKISEINCLIDVLDDGETKDLFIFARHLLKNH